MFFLVQTLVVVVAATVHALVDRKPDKRTKRRVVELFLIWLVAAGGAMAVVAGYQHIGPGSDALAARIGYTPSMFQWEIGWADIAIGVVGFLCIWKRDSWLTCAVVVLAIGYWGDAIGHIMQYSVHNNTAPLNVWAIPSDVLQPLIAICLLIAYRRLSRSQTSADAEADATSTGTVAIAEAAAADS